MIAGIGVDIVEVGRIRQTLERHPERFLQRVFTPAEAAYCDGGGEHRSRRLAARFAAKEAALKALGLGLRGVKWTDVEVVHDGAGKPVLRLAGQLAQVAADLGVTELHVSLSHSKEYAIAQVVAVR